MTVVLLRKKKEDSVLRYHHWIFSGAIQKIYLDADNPYSEPQEGELVRVESSEGVALGVGHFQVGTIAVRMLAFGVERLPDDFYAHRLSLAYQLRKQMGLIRAQNDTYRLVHGEGDFLPGLVVDIYGDTAVVQAHSVGMHRSRFEIAQTLIKVVPSLRNVYYKSDDTLPFKAQIDGEKHGYLLGEGGEQPIWARENGLLFRIDWFVGQKTGFFIDQRENRCLLEHFANGRDVLNMFCYTGGFSVYALRGGARSVHSVDVSEKAIALVDANVQKNFPNCANHQSFAMDAFEFMSDIRNRYDLIVLDPPAFAKHRDAIPNALKGYKRLNARAIENIKAGGILFTFSCYFIIFYIEKNLRLNVINRVSSSILLQIHLKISLKFKHLII